MLDLFYADLEHVCYCVQLAAIECLTGRLKPGSKSFGIAVAFHPHGFNHAITRTREWNDVRAAWSRVMSFLKPFEAIHDT